MWLDDDSSQGKGGLMSHAINDEGEKKHEA